MPLTFHTNYWHDREARRAFQAFIREIHGLDFTAWEEAGYWDEAYRPFSFFEEGRVVSSVCLYLLDAIVDGHATKLAQISGVGTHPDWRRQGLNRKLTEEALAWARGKHEGIFLFSDDEAIPFYERCGFRPREEFIESLAVASRPACREPIRLALDVVREREIIEDYARDRAPISNRLSVGNMRLLMFHLLYLFGKDIYYVPELGLIVVYRRAGGRLEIFDIIGRQIPSLPELYPFIADTTDRTVDFHFGTDKLALHGVQTRVLKGNNLFVDEAFPVESPVFPYTGRA